jgi:hypothetical protein
MEEGPHMGRQVTARFTHYADCHRRQTLRRAQTKDSSPIAARLRKVRSQSNTDAGPDCVDDLLSACDFGRDPQFTAQPPPRKESFEVLA